MDIPTAIPLLTMIVNLAMGITVYRLNPRSRAALAFFLLTIVFGLWQASAALQRASGPEEAVLWNKVQYAGASLVILGFTNFTHNFLKRGKTILGDRRLRYSLYSTSIITALLCMSGLIITNEISEGSYIFLGWSYSVHYGGFGPLYALFVFVFILGIILNFVAYLQSFHTEDSDNRRRGILLVLAGAVVVGVIGSLTDVILPLFNIRMPTAELLTLVEIIFMAVAMIKYKIFVVRSPSETGGAEGTPRPIQLPTGDGLSKYILAPVRRGGEHIELFNGLMEKGHGGIVITGRNPSEMKEKLIDAKVPVVWVTDRRSNKRHLNPVQDTELLETMTYFFDRTGGGIVLLDHINDYPEEFYGTYDKVWELHDALGKLDTMLEENEASLIVPLVETMRDNGPPDEPVLVTEEPWWYFRPYLRNIVRHGLVEGVTRGLDNGERAEMMHNIDRLSNRELTMIRKEKEWILRGPDPERREDVLDVLRTLLTALNLIDKPDLGDRVIERVKELGLKEMEMRLHPGGAYLVLEEDRATVYEMIKALADHRPCILVTKRSPALMRKNHVIPDTCEILWPSKGKDLSEGDIGHKVRSVGTGLEHIHREMKEFKAREDCHVVLLEAFEYLVSQNGFDSVFRFVERIVDDITTSDSIFLMPVDPDFMEPGQVALLTKIMEKI